MNPSKLSLNLIPSTSGWKNTRSKISKSQGDLIRKKVYQQANYICEICQVKNVRLDCNEVGDYHRPTLTQKLVRLEAICRLCHLVQHMGYASIIGKHQVAFEHLLKVNGGSGKQGQKYVQTQFAEGEERSKVNGNLDYRVLERYLKD